MKFFSKDLNNCKWSKDPVKRYRQLGHYLYNIKNYDLNINDIMKLQALRNDLYKIINKK